MDEFFKGGKWLVSRRKFIELLLDIILYSLHIVIRDTLNLLDALCAFYIELLIDGT